MDPERTWTSLGLDREFSLDVDLSATTTRGPFPSGTVTLAVNLACATDTGDTRRTAATATVTARGPMASHGGGQVSASQRPLPSSRRSPLFVSIRTPGGVAERLNAPVLKTGGPVRVSRVRIPPPPPHRPPSAVTYDAAVRRRADATVVVRTDDGRVLCPCCRPPTPRRPGCAASSAATSRPTRSADQAGVVDPHVLHAVRHRRGLPRPARAGRAGRSWACPVEDGEQTWSTVGPGTTRRHLREGRPT